MRHKPKKSLGQNFLTDKNMQEKVLRTCGFTPLDTVLEIGAGRAEMTRLIVKQVKKIYALELDRQLACDLKQDFGGSPSVEVINEDILKFQITQKFKKFPGRIKVFGNIPYYITTPIIEHLLEHRKKIESIYITVQKEVAERIVAQKQEEAYGSLSCFLQYYTTPEILLHIKRNCFTPIPGVDSCLLRLVIKRKTELSSADSKRLFKIIRAAFNQRRKALKNSLKGILAQGKIAAFLSHRQIDPLIRPEQLALSDFIALIKNKNIQNNY